MEFGNLLPHTTVHVYDHCDPPNSLYKNFPKANMIGPKGLKIEIKTM